MQSLPPDIMIHTANFLDGKSAARLSATSTDLNTSLEGQFIHGVCKHCATRLEMPKFHFSWNCSEPEPECVECRRIQSHSYEYKLQLETCPGCKNLVDVQHIWSCADKKGEFLSHIRCPRCETVIDTEDVLSSSLISN